MERAQLTSEARGEKLSTEIAVRDGSVGRETVMLRRELEPQYRTGHHGDSEYMLSVGIEGWQIWSTISHSRLAASDAAPVSQTQHRCNSLGLCRER